MGVKATLSVIGMYQYDPVRFESCFVFPESLTSVQKQDVYDNIVLECGELRLLYTEPSFLYMAIRTWSRKNTPIWQKIMDILAIEYDPQYNYNRYEESEDDMQKTGTDTKTMTGTDTIARTGTDTLAKTGTIQTQSGSTSTRDLDKTDNRDTSVSESQDTDRDNTSDTLVSVNGYNTTSSPNNMAPHDDTKSDSHEDVTSTKTATEDMDRAIAEDETITDSSSGTTTNNLTDTETKNLQDQETRNLTDMATKNLRDYLVHTSHMWGNIGTMTTQQMLREELELRRINIIDIIVAEFKRQFCLGVY